MPTSPREGISGPHVAAAFLCEKVLNERDGVPSFIRVVERFTIPMVPDGMQVPHGVVIPPRAIQFVMVIVLKAGDLPTGRYGMKVTLVKPDYQQNSQEFSVFFNGPNDNGIAVISPMVIPDPEEGLYWFDVHFGDDQITRIPFRVINQPLQFMPGPPHE